MTITRPLFKDRTEAGQKLSLLLREYMVPNSLVLALPRGGVPVGYEVAKHFKIPLDVVITRKLGLPGNPEFGIGAIAENKVEILSKEAKNQIYVSAEQLAEVSKQEKEELQRRKALYREGRNLPNLTGKTIFLIDDGLATGLTARAAIESISRLNPKQLILATPVCAKDTAQNLVSIVDHLVCLHALDDFVGVGLWYGDFTQVDDETVISILKEYQFIKMA